mmetsp:Transcript_136864/g.193576  ORF Transcript_136864/g.193576 Transcript_136864/m.193576 type:complete len:321 (+) Transcript_136864:433-1395(+)
MLTLAPPAVEWEVELGCSRMAELVLVEKLEVGPHHRLPRVLPALFEDHLGCPAEVLLVPGPDFLLKLRVVQPGISPPGSLGFWIVRGRERHKEGSQGHGNAHLSAEHQKLKAHPSSDGMAPHQVRHAVRELLVGHGEEVRSEGLCGRVLGGLQELVSPWVVEGQKLDLLALLDPADERSARPCVDGLCTASIVEAENSQFGLVQGEAEDLVLHAVQLKCPFILLGLRVGFNFALEAGISLNRSCRVSGSTHVFRGSLVLVFPDYQLLAANLQAYPALFRPSTCQALVVQAFAHELQLFDQGASGKSVRQLLRLQILALSH